MNRLPHDPVIVSYARSPLGKYGGILRDFRPDEMLAMVLDETLKRAHIESQDLAEVIAGCANQAGEDNRNVARMAQLLARFPVSCSAITLNRLCASGLDAAIYAARLIALKEAKVVLASGVESMTRAPLVMAKASAPFKLGAPETHDSSLGWRFFNENMRSITPPEPNGVTAERLAEQFSISRTRQDQFALLSHQRAIWAHNENLLKKEIMGFPILKNGETTLLDRDEGPRNDTSLSQLEKLKASFVKDGTVTAGNSSPLSDGAAALTITSHEYANAHGLKPLARIIGFAQA
ncbi:MAG TPA: thiolase family protein, partial [Myxococcota bacterium]|nr:thiolase family protein [Myxococcota bacterium]